MIFPHNPMGAGLGLLLSFSLSSVAVAAEPKKAEPKASWNEKMKSLGLTFQELLVDLSSDERFNNPRNFKRIEKNAEKFAKLAHDLKDKGAPAPDADPSVQIIASQFANEAKHAAKTLQWGHRAYARDILRSMSGYCMACHTRSGGPGFAGADVSSTLKELKALERADYFASTRQFDAALSEYEKILDDAEAAKSKPFEWERAARSSLAIAVRVKKDPERALSIVERISSASKAPFFLKEQANQWKASLNAWKAEPSVRPQSEEGYRAQALQLIAQARELQKFPADRSADILYLRASSAVHDLLSFAPKGKYSTEALYLAGLCYEVLEDLNLWDMHEFYYLACIHKSPHSQEARRCFRHYEQSVYMGFTGSSGTSLPSEIEEKLQFLDKLSRPEAGSLQ
jgi:hypothetical protein